MVPLMARAPIDEVVVGFILDQAVGPDAVDSGCYLATRADRFVRHEIHEPILSTPGFFEVPGPARVWLISADDAWLVQLQQDRFHANWRRRGNAPYPGFTREGGAMHFAVDEFARFQAFCQATRGITPNAVSIELSKIDLLIMGKHWADNADAAKLMPVLDGIFAMQTTRSGAVALRWHEDIGDVNIAVAIGSAQLKAAPGVPAFRVDFRASCPVTGDITEHLVRTNGILNDAFSRLIPDPARRFS
ncbi:MAG TPA: hypothetical protein VFD36_26345 [Kofleriaceae bacterium]|nr:hypothetical protein [Kofleriaceae bacterium]